MSNELKHTLKDRKGGSVTVPAPQTAPQVKDNKKEIKKNA